MQTNEEKTMMDEETEEVVDQGTSETTEEEKAGDGADGKLKMSERKKLKKLEAELVAAQKALAAKDKELAEEKERYVRMFSEYDNFRRRTAKEKDSIYADAMADAVKELLPVIDNLERAAAIAPTEGQEGLGQGVALTLKSAMDTLHKLGVSEIETETFDPNVHNAVMHIDDESFGEGQIVDVFQKGYIRGDKVIRFAMVKVAN